MTVVQQGAGQELPQATDLPRVCVTENRGFVPVAAAALRLWPRRSGHLQIPLMVRKWA